MSETTKRTVAVPVPYVRGGERVSKDGRLGWRLRPWDPRAKRQLDRVFYGTEHEAVVEMARLREEMEAAAQPQLPAAHLVTVEDWALAWLQRYTYKVRPANGQPGIKRSKGTIDNVTDVLDYYVIPALGPNTKMRSLTYEQIEEAVAGLRLVSGQPASASTKEKAASVIRRMFSGAVKAGVLPANPAAELQSTWGDGGRRTVVVPSLPQVDLLADTLEGQWAGRGAAVRLFAFTGLRWMELSAMRWDDVDLEARTLRVRDSKTDAGVRYALLLDQALEPLEQLRAYAQARNSEYILCGSRGGRLSYDMWRTRIARARATCGVNYSTHKLRHVAVSIMIAAGATPRQVADQVGHTSSSVSERVYTHAFQMNRRDLAIRLSQMITGIEVHEADEDADDE